MQNTHISIKIWTGPITNCALDFNSKLDFQESKKLLCRVTLIKLVLAFTAAKRVMSDGWRSLESWRKEAKGQGTTRFATLPSLSFHALFFTGTVYGTEKSNYTFRALLLYTCHSLASAAGGFHVKGNNENFLKKRTREGLKEGGRKFQHILISCHWEIVPLTAWYGSHSYFIQTVR